MSIASEITRLNNAKAAIKQSLANKGVEVSDSALLDEYPALIDSIEVGSGEGGDPYYEYCFNIMTKNNTNYNGLFSYYTGTELDVSKLDTSNVTSMNHMFGGCTNLTSLDVSNFNTNKVQDMTWMFSSCEKLTELDISSFDLNNIGDMNYMFSSCTNLSTITLTLYRPWNAENSSYLFSGCSSLTQINNINTWVLGTVTNFSNMFSGCSSLESLDLSNWSTSNATDMSNMFSGCSSLSELNIRNFDMNNVSNADDMFANCYNLTTLHLDECNYDTVNKIITSSGFPADNHGTIYCKSENVAGLTAPGNWTFELISSGCYICGSPDCEYPTRGQNARCPECRLPYRTPNSRCITHVLHGFGSDDSGSGRH